MLIYKGFLRGRKKSAWLKPAKVNELEEKIRTVSFKNIDAFIGNML